MSKDKIKCSKEVENENISGGCCHHGGKHGFHGPHGKHGFGHHRNKGDFHKEMMPSPHTTFNEINCSNAETSNDGFKSVVTDGPSVSRDDSNSTKP